MKETAAVSDKKAIEAALNLANNPDQEWTYNSSADAWVLSVVIAVTNPVLENEEGVSVWAICRAVWITGSLPAVPAAALMR